MPVNETDQKLDDIEERPLSASPESGTEDAAESEPSEPEA